MRPTKKGKVNDAIHSVNVTRTVRFSTTQDENTAFVTVPVVALLTSSKIHLDLSNVWNNYKVDSINIVITPLHMDDIDVIVDGVRQKIRDYFKIFSAWDDNEVSRQLRYSDIKAYQTYKDVTTSSKASNECPILSNSFKPMMKFMDTKKTPNQGTLIVGINAPSPFGEEIEIAFSIMLTFSVCYSVVRLDKSWVSTMIAPEFQKLPTEVKMIDRIPPQITQLVYYASNLQITYETNINDAEFTYKETAGNVEVPKGYIVMTLKISGHSGTFKDFSWYTIAISDSTNPASGFNKWIFDKTYYKIYPRPDVWTWATLQDNSGKIWYQAHLGGQPDIDLFHFPNLSEFVKQY